MKFKFMSAHQKPTSIAIRGSAHVERLSWANLGCRTTAIDSNTVVRDLTNVQRIEDQLQIITAYDWEPATGAIGDSEKLRART